MSSRMDKYKEETVSEEIPTRSNKNKELYKQIYNAYDEFENLVVPSNAREIDPSELKKEVTSRQEYRKRKDYDDITNSGSVTNNSVIRKEMIQEKEEQALEIYDINELLNKATSASKKPELIEPTLVSGDYLKKLKLDNRKTNIEQVKEMYDDIAEETLEEDESLMKTANLSLEILSDLKGDGEKTAVSAPIKSDEMPEESTLGFYSNTYKFSAKDFDDKDKEEEEDEDEEEDDDEIEEGNNGKFFFKILLLIFGLLLVVLVLVYFIGYFNKV